MARKSASQKAVEQQFVARPDGDWDYFPKGLAKPGVRVDDKTRQRLMSNSQMLTWQIGLLMAGAVALVRFGGPAIAGSYPEIAPYANSRVICWAAVIPIVVLALRLVVKMHGAERDRLVKGAEPAMASFTMEDVSARAVAIWKERSLFRRFLLHAFMLGIAAVAAVGAHDRFQLQGTVSLIEGILLALFAAVIGFGWLFLLVRLAGQAKLAANSTELN